MKTVTKESAFPIAVDLSQNIEWHKGMTLRDYFAAKAMQGLMNEDLPEDDIALYAYWMADAMLKRREMK